MKSAATTCSNCNKEYSTKQTAIILSKLEKETSVEPLQTRPDLCLSCIIANLHAAKSLLIPDLTKALATFEALSKAHKRAEQRKQHLAKQHSIIDQQQSYIEFFIRQAIAAEREKESNKANAGTNKPAAKHKPRKPSAKVRQKQTDIIAALMSSMTPEQRAKVVEQALQQRAANGANK